MTALPLRIDRISLASGTSLVPGDFTVAIGPNNGGKSRFLKELVGLLTGVNAPRLSVEAIDFEPRDQFRALVASLQGDPNGLDESGNLVLDGIDPELMTPRQMRPGLKHVESLSSAQHDNGGKQQILGLAGHHFVAHLTTESRLALVKKHTNRQENIRGAQSPLHAAYRANETAIYEVSAYVHAAFGMDLVIDKSDFAVTEFRLAPDGKAHDNRSVAEMSKLERLDEQGDGIRAFSGVIVSVALVDRPIVFVDEPEAFLHPPQAFLIGRALAALKGRGHQIFVATHNADVLRGILSGTRDVSIVRFARRDEAFLTEALDPAELDRIAQDPVLSSARVLDGLFYDGAIIVESDGDVVVYRRVLEQLGLGGTFHFVNSYSKQSSARVAQPYRAMAVPCAMIVDFDILRVRDEFKRFAEGAGAEWAAIEPSYNALLDIIEVEDLPEDRLVDVVSELQVVQADLEAAGDPRVKLQAARPKLGSIRESASEWRQLKKSGLSSLSEEGRAQFAVIDAALREKGAFIVPVGEREGWLPVEAPYKRNKNAWTVDALEALQEPLAPGHSLRTFMENVRDYLNPPPAPEREPVQDAQPVVAEELDELGVA